MLYALRYANLIDTRSTETNFSLVDKIYKEFEQILNQWLGSDAPLVLHFFVDKLGVINILFDSPEELNSSWHTYKYWQFNVAPSQEAPPPLDALKKLPRGVGQYLIVNEKASVFQRCRLPAVETKYNPGLNIERSHVIPLSYKLEWHHRSRWVPLLYFLSAQPQDTRLTLYVSRYRQETLKKQNATMSYASHCLSLLPASTDGYPDQEEKLDVSSLKGIAGQEKLYTIAWDSTMPHLEKQILQAIEQDCPPGTFRGSLTLEEIEKLAPLPVQKRLIEGIVHGWTFDDLVEFLVPPFSMEGEVHGIDSYTLDGPL